MFVILTYDVKQKRQSKIRKICKKYLFHAQKSVFEGYLTEAQLTMLKNELASYVDPDEDSLCVYKVPNYRNMIKDELGYSLANDIDFSIYNII